MGCYAYICTDCPHCGQYLEFQDNVGGNGEIGYSINASDIPDGLIEDCAGTAYCRHCEKSSVLEFCQNPSWRVRKN